MYKKMMIGFVIFTFAGMAMGETIDTVVVTDAPGPDTVKVVETKVETVKVAEVKGEAGTTNPEGTSETATSTGTSDTTQMAASAGTTSESNQQARSGAGEYKVQLGAFQVKENADGFYTSLKTQFGDAFYVENTGTYWKVGAGTYETGQSAVAARKTFISQGYSDAFITR